MGHVTHGRAPFHEGPYPAPQLQPRQAQRVAPTDYENLLADALESVFGVGVWELPAIVERLNAEGIRAADGAAWTTDSLERELARLAA